MQKEDFIGIFEEMAGLPVTIRLLDPPLHEFLPKNEEEIRTDRHGHGHFSRYDPKQSAIASRI